MTRPSPTLSQMIDRANREVRWRRRARAANRAASFLISCAIFASAALIFTLMTFERMF